VPLHFLTLFKNVWMWYRTFSHSLKKSVIAQSLFQNEQMCKNVQKKCKFEITLFCTLKRAIAQLPFQKGRISKTVQKKGDFQLTFFLLLRKGDRPFLKWARAQPCLLDNLNIQNLHFFAHFCTFAFLKSAITLFGRSFKKCNCMIALFFALF